VFGNPLLASAAMDRLLHHAQCSSRQCHLLLDPAMACAGAAFAASEQPSAGQNDSSTYAVR
jgi:hypothetical protein